MTRKRYLVVYESTPNNWGAYAPDIDGLAATAHTRPQMERQIREAIEFTFDCMIDEGEPIPEPRATPQPEWEDWGWVDVEVPDAATQRAS